VTRARETLRVFASAEAIRAMMARRIVRDSGLAERIWSD
jgi:ATP-dependent exoDNAse (exonuclease V) alpha subunit